MLRAITKQTEIVQKKFRRWSTRPKVTWDPMTQYTRSFVTSVRQQRVPRSYLAFIGQILLPANEPPSCAALLNIYNFRSRFSVYFRRRTQSKSVGTKHTVIRY